MTVPYCRNCGNLLAAEATFCPSCGVALPKGNSYCQNCGNQVSPLAEVCVKCGSRLSQISTSHKSKVASVLLAVFLSFWTWLYTYKRDKKKFWIALGVNVFLGIISTALMVSAIISAGAAGAVADDAAIVAAVLSAMGFYVVLTLVGTGFWVWAIVDSAVKKQEWYNNY